MQLIDGFLKKENWRVFGALRAPGDPMHVWMFACRYGLKQTLLEFEETYEIGGIHVTKGHLDKAGHDVQHLDDAPLGHRAREAAERSLSKLMDMSITKELDLTPAKVVRDSLAFQLISYEPTEVQDALPYGAEARNCLLRLRSTNLEFYTSLAGLRKRSGVFRFLLESAPQVERSGQSLMIVLPESPLQVSMLVDELQSWHVGQSFLQRVLKRASTAGHHLTLGDVEKLEALTHIAYEYEMEGAACVTYILLGISFKGKSDVCSRGGDPHVCRLLCV